MSRHTAKILDHAKGMQRQTNALLKFADKIEKAEYALEEMGFLPESWPRSEQDRARFRGEAVIWVRQNVGLAEVGALSGSLIGVMGASDLRSFTVTISPGTSQGHFDVELGVDIPTGF